MYKREVKEKYMQEGKQATQAFTFAFAFSKLCRGAGRSDRADMQGDSFVRASGRVLIYYGKVHVRYRKPASRFTSRLCADLPPLCNSEHTNSF